MTAVDPNVVEKNNQKWWERHTESGDFPSQTETPITTDGGDFPSTAGNRYGPYIYCPMPVSGVTKWGFRRKEGLALFLEDVKAGQLPKGGRTVGKSPALAAPSAAVEGDPFAALDLGDPPKEEDPFAALDLGQDPMIPAQMEGDDDAPETDEWGQVIAKDDDPFADLL